MLPAPPVEVSDEDSPVAPRMSTANAIIDGVTLLDQQPTSFATSSHTRVPYTPASDFGPLQSMDATRRSGYRQTQDLIHDSAVDACMVTNMELQADFEFDPMDPFFTGYELDCTFAPFPGQRR